MNEESFDQERRQVPNWESTEWTSAIDAIQQAVFGFRKCRHDKEIIVGDVSTLA